MTHRFLGALACAGLLLLPLGPVAAKGKHEGEEEKPKPTADELKEIRSLAVRVGRGRHPALKGKAIGELARYGPKAEAAVPALVAAMKDRDVSVASAAAAALGEVGRYSKEAVKALSDAVSKGRDVHVRTAAAEALGKIGPAAAKAARALVAALTDEEPDLRREAALALGRLGMEVEKLAVSPLEGRLDDEPRIRAAAAISLARLGRGGEARVVEVLRAAVPEASKLPIEVRHEACEALALAGPAARAAAGALIGVVREETRIHPAMPYPEQRREQHHALRRAAAKALGALGDPEALPALREAEQEPALAEAARAAIAQLEGDAGN